MIVLILILTSKVIADNRLRDGCEAKETEAPWIVYIRNCALPYGDFLVPSVPSNPVRSTMTTKQRSRLR